jgi:hypothetical protein
MEELIAGDGIEITRDSSGRLVVSIRQPQAPMFIQMACGMWGGNGGAGTVGTVNAGTWNTNPSFREIRQSDLPLDTTDPKTAKKYQELFL